MKVEIAKSKAYLYTPYNRDFVAKIKMISSAKWDADKACWVIPAEAVDVARQYMLDIYGETDEQPDNKVTVKIVVREELCGSRTDVNLLGKCLCRAYGRNSGGKAGDDVYYVSGSPRSGGSAQNWKSIVPCGAELILKNVSARKYHEYLQSPLEEIEVELIGGDKKPERELLEEKQKLLKRLKEIEEALSEKGE